MIATLKLRVMVSTEWSKTSTGVSVEDFYLRAGLMVYVLSNYPF